MSGVGRWTAGGFVTDGATSPTIDAGDPALNVGVDLGFGLEPAPNGNVANQGSYGLTAQASETGPYPGCAVSKKVGAGEQFATISAALTADLKANSDPLTGYSCVVIEDGATYAEQVTVANFTMGVSSISIFADPASGLTPSGEPRRQCGGVHHHERVGEHLGNQRGSGRRSDVRHLRVLGVRVDQQRQRHRSDRPYHQRRAS